MTAKEMREKRAALVADARKILDKADAEKRQPTAEERSAWAKIMGDKAPDGSVQRGEVDTLKDQIDEVEKKEADAAAIKARQDAIEIELRQPVPAANGQPLPGREPAKGNDGAKSLDMEHQRALALQAWVRAQCGKALTDEQAEACKTVGMNPSARELAFNLRTGDDREIQREIRNRAHGIYEQRAGAANAQSVALNASGGALVPEGFVNNLEVALLQYGGIREVADVMRTQSGNDLPWPTLNDTTVKGSILGENVVVSTSDVSFGTIVFHAYKYTSGLALVPVELMEDSAFNLASTLGDLLGIRIGRIQADHFTTGSGGGQPTGVVTAAVGGWLSWMLRL